MTVSACGLRFWWCDGWVWSLRIGASGSLWGVSRFIRRGRSASGAVTVQVVNKDGSRIVDVVHVGSANTDADLAVLMEQAEAMLHPDQEMLDVGAVRHAALSEVAEGTKARQRPLEAPARGRPRSSACGGGVVVGQPARLLWQVLCEAYEHLGFACLDDDAFMKIVLARIVEPTSKVDSVRVLDERISLEAPSISSHHGRPAA